MGALPNPRHERVARLYVLTGNKSKAYREAGYTDHRSNAHRMMANDNIKDRITELLETGLSEQLSPELVTAGLMSRALGKDTKDSAAIRAWELLGKTEQGGRLFLDRIESFDSASPEEVLKALEGLLPDALLDQFKKDLGLAEAEGDLP